MRAYRQCWVIRSPLKIPVRTSAFLMTRLSDFENFERRQVEPNSHPKLGAFWIFGGCAEGEYKHWIAGCQSCPDGCAICKGSKFSGPECQLCETGRYLDAENDCIECVTNCDSCTSSQCTKCANGFESLDSGATCTAIECDDGSYFDSFNNRCNICPDANHCTLCSDATTCDSCEDGYYLHTASKTCRACDASCGTCTGAADNECTACEDGSFLNTGGLALGLGTAPEGTCDDCSKGCNKCSAAGTCIGAKKPGYAVPNPSSNSGCSDGYYYKTLDGTCAACHASCLTCTAAGASSCDSCAEGEYLTNTNTCAECGGDCLTCEGSATTCTSTCADGFYFDAGHCEPCAIGCNTCSDDSSCSNGDYKTGYGAAEPYDSTGCSDGYYFKASDGTCDACEAHCEACDDASTCTDCFDGYYLAGGSCF